MKFARMMSLFLYSKRATGGAGAEGAISSGGKKGMFFHHDRRYARMYERSLRPGAHPTTGSRQTFLVQAKCACL